MSTNMIGAITVDANVFNHLASNPTGKKKKKQLSSQAQAAVSAALKATPTIPLPEPIAEKAIQSQEINTSYQDFSEYFLSIQTFDSASKTNTIFLIPKSQVFTQLPEVVKNHPEFLSQYQDLYSQIPVAALKGQYITSLKKENGCPVYEVTSLFPLKIRNMRSADFYSYFGSSLKDLIFEHLGVSLFNQTKVTVESQNHEQQSSLKVIANCKSPGTQALDKDDSTKLLAIEDNQLRIKKMTILGCIRFAFDHLKIDLAKAVSQHGTNISPYEPMRTLWDVLSIAIIHEASNNPKEIVALTKIVLEHWEEIFYLLRNVMDEGITHNPELVTSNLTAIIKQCMGLRESLEQVMEKSNSKAQKSIGLIENIHLPLMKILHTANSLEDDEDRSEVCQKLCDFLNQTLGDWSTCRVYMDNSKRVLQNWLLTRTNTIEIYFSMIESPSTEISGFYKSTQSITEAFKEHNWLAAYQQMNSLIDQMKVYTTPTSYLFYPSPHKGETIVLANITRGETQIIRIYQFVRALRNDFKTMITDGKLFQIFSEVAFKELKVSYDTIKTPLNKKEGMGKSLFNWAGKLSRVGYSELQDVIREMKETWTLLKDVREQVRGSKDLEASLSSLFEIIQSDKLEDLLKQNSEVFQQLVEPLQRWEDGLRQINQCIIKIQQYALLIVNDPSLPTINLEELQNEFNAFNERLEELIKPTTIFFNAYRHLICIKQNSSPSNSQPQSSGQIDLDFTKEGTFTLYLFETDSSIFSAIENQRQLLNQIDGTATFEVEEEANGVDLDSVTVTEIEEAQQPKTLLSSEQNEAPSTLTDQLQQIFQHNTKTRKIKRELKDLLRQVDVPFSTCFGKGDHNKLYVNGIPIVLPEHREWKPGTGRSIQNDLILQIQEALKDH